MGNHLPMLVMMGFSLSELTEARVTLEQLQRAGASPKLLIKAGCTADEVRGLQGPPRFGRVAAAYTEDEIRHLDWILQAHTDDVTSCVFSRDDEHIVSISEDNTAWAWRLNDGAQVACFKSHNDE